MHSPTQTYAGKVRISDDTSRTHKNNKSRFSLFSFCERLDFAFLCFALIAEALRWCKHALVTCLCFVVVAMVVANAFVSGVLSGLNHRYQCRVIWLIPLLAGIFLLDWLE
ncbi:MAG: hypothetical protein ABSB30_11885 [Terracidiphilus sp.]|jgi:hypothetical protein